MMELNKDLVYAPRRIISIVSSSRSGSTIFKHALCLHPDLCCLAGEEEPYYKLARNGYPWHQSDEFHEAHEGELIRSCIANELHGYNRQANRKYLQDHEIEEPPFVEPIVCKRTDTLVLKTPQNCYRRGVLELLYPGVPITYLCLKRDPRAIVNGLLDGWHSEDFKARKVGPRWWKFDMPPNWQWGNSVLERCINQWRQSWKFMDRDYEDAIATIWFEWFERNWQACIQRVWWMLDLPTYTTSNVQLPHLACTATPKVERWRTVRPHLEGLLRSYGW